MSFVNKLFSLEQETSKFGSVTVQNKLSGTSNQSCILHTQSAGF